MTGHCEYFDDADGSPYQGQRCPNPVAAFVEPKPIGDFKPAGLCFVHVFPWTRDHEFHLGSDWSITAVSPDAARILASMS